MTKSILKYLVFIAAFWFSQQLIAQRPLLYNKELIEDPQVRFKRLTTNDGLSHNYVTDILQDKQGCVWVATKNGLNKYDGNSFEIFLHNDDNYTSLSSGFVLCMAENERGELFIGTEKGLNLFKRSTNDFEFVPIDTLSRPPVIRQLFFDNDSILWIETEEGYLVKFNIRNRSIIESYKHDPVNQKYYLYHDIYRDKMGVLWLGMRNQPPMYLDELANKIVRLPVNESDYSLKRAYDMACYYEDSHGNFWFTALDGIYIYNRDNRDFKKFIGTTTYDVHEDRNGDIWFATGSGVMKYDVARNELTLMHNEKDNPNSISNNSVHKILEDKMGNLWFGTSKGVNVYSPPLYPFYHYTHIPGIENSPEGYEVTAVAEDHDQNLWIGYANDGVDLFDRKTMTFTHYTQKTGNSIAANNVNALYHDGTYLWIGLWRGIGFNRYDPVKDRFTLYTYYSKSLEKDWYSDFCEDNEGNFYIGFWGSDGLVPFDREQGKFLQPLKDKFDRVECSRLITDMLVDKNGSLWFGTTDCGLHRYFPDKDSAISYFSDADNPSGLYSNNVSSITLDAQNNIWFVNSAIQRYDEDLDSIINSSDNNYLGISDYVSIVSDDSSKLWVGTSSNGLLKYDPLSKSVVQYLKDDGLYTNSFSDAALKLSTGELFFGTNNGFIIFDPKTINIDTELPAPSFGKLYVYDHIVNYDLNSETEIVLPPVKNTFTVDLLSSDIVNTGRYLFLCKLEGYDGDWVEINNLERKARYASVPPGRYTLKYRLADRNGNWTENPSRIDFIVQKPFYTTWWFYAIIIAGITIVIVLVVKQREFDLKQKNRNIELQQKLFRLQMNPHFMYNSLLAIQNFIFSHEPKEAGNYLSDFAKLFRLILRNSKSEFIKLSQEIDTLNLYLSLQSLRYPDKFNYSIYIDDSIDSELIMIPPMLAQPMIENALEHGLYYKEGRGNIDIRFEKQGSQLLLEVKDNGIGLTLSRTKNKTGHKSMALDITRERIRVLGKRYNYYSIFEIDEIKDKEDNILGTLVRFNLPVKNSLTDSFEEQ